VAYRPELPNLAGPMSLDIGIVGLPNVGKSTLFNALTAAGALAANYPFATIDPNVGVVPIRDGRLEVLARIFGSKEIVPATVKFVDIAGLVEGASRGEGLGNKFLGNIRDVSAVCHVVRAFRADNVTHLEEGIDPARDIAIIETELALADLETIEKRLPRLEKEATVDRKLGPVVDLFRRLHSAVSSGTMIWRDPQLMDRRDEFADLHLLTAKPVIFVFNSDSGLLGDEDRQARLRALVSPAEALFLDAEFEAELASLNRADSEEMLAAAGLEEAGLDRMIRAAYATLGLQSFLTAGPKETRAWTIRAGATAHEAAGVIHSDFQRGFIAAEVVDYDRLVGAGSWQAARAAGLVRSEGKTYVMRPNDVVEFRFNV
jgi:ribosome-binding ATPase